VHRTQHRTLHRTRGASGQFIAARVLLGFVHRTRGASGHVPPDASGRVGSLLDSHRTRALWRPVGPSARPVVVSRCAARC
jgi:hypothetical protein